MIDNSYRILKYLMQQKKDQYIISDIMVYFQLDHKRWLDIKNVFDTLSDVLICNDIIIIIKKRVELLCLENFDRPLNSPVNLFLALSSTNTYLLNDLHLTNYSVCIAEQQTQGKGQRDKSWFSPFAQNLYFSYAWFVNISSKLQCISLVVAIIICQQLALLGVKGVKIKWPNDIYLDNKKLAGILIEIKKYRGEQQAMIIGCGINYDMSMFSDLPIDQDWVDLRMYRNDFTRAQLLKNIITALDDFFMFFSQEKLWMQLSKWSVYDFLYGKYIEYQGIMRSYGKMIGINAQGHLLLETPNKEQLSISSGSVRVIS